MTGPYRLVLAVHYDLLIGLQSFLHLLLKILEFCFDLLFLYIKPSVHVYLLIQFSSNKVNLKSKCGQIFFFNILSAWF